MACYIRSAFFVIAIVAMPRTVQCQSVDFGVKIGIPITSAFENNSQPPRFNYIANTKRYTGGPTVEMSLPGKFALEADALYKRLDYDATIMGVDTFTRESTTANSWEIPVLLKKYLVKGPLRPFGDIGVSFRHVQGSSHVVTTVFPSRVLQNTTHPPELINSWAEGAVLGAGLELRAGFLHLVPEVRYTRMTRDNFRSSTGAFQSNRNQLDFLMGLVF